MSRQYQKYAFSPRSSYLEPRTFMSGWFISGTDTGVGKTRVAQALLAALAQAGHAAVGMKPVASGARPTPAGLRHADAEALRAASGVPADYDDVNPYCFAPPIAPHIAAREAGVPIRMAVIAKSYAGLARRVDIVVVEGVGGLLVPLGRAFDAADIPLQLGLPVVLVVGLRLGCLSHTLLTVEALRARGLRLAGWIANRIDPDMARAAQNLQTLRARLRAPLLGTIPHARNPQSAKLARVLDVKRLDALI